MPTDAPPPASKYIAESLHRKIQIVSRAVRLLEHKLRRDPLLSVSNILSIIHKEEEKIKRCWLVVKKGTWLQSWHSSYIWPNVGFLSPAIVRNIYIPEAVSTVHVIVLIWEKQMTGIIMCYYQICCQLVQITVLTYYCSSHFCKHVWLKLTYSDWFCLYFSVYYL